jgi:hypothetical protein
MGAGSVERKPQPVALWIRLGKHYAQAGRLRRPTPHPLSYRREVPIIPFVRTLAVGFGFEGPTGRRGTLQSVAATLVERKISPVHIDAAYVRFARAPQAS